MPSWPGWSTLEPSWMGSLSDVSLLRSQPLKRVRLHRILLWSGLWMRHRTGPVAAISNYPFACVKDAQMNPMPSKPQLHGQLAVVSLGIGACLFLSPPVVLSAQHPSQQRLPQERTLELLESPRGIEALEHFRAWDTLGRPGVEPLNTQRMAPAVGETRTFRVFNFVTSAYNDVPATLESASGTTHIWVADDSQGPSKISPATLVPLQAGLEELTPAGSYDVTQGILELETQIFGPRPDVEGTGALNILITDIQDGWTPSCGCAYTAGFFDPNDLDTSDPDSNAMDLLYVDAYPSLYTDAGPGDPATVLSTLAHELQHLIHAGFGALALFQNEGQSEFAQQLCGYPARVITYLDETGQTNVPLFAWRGGDQTRVDYQRASLFHAFLSGWIGEAALGPVTQASTSGWDAYAPALGGSSRSETLSRFHLTSWINDADAGYAFGETPQAGVRKRTPTLELGGAGVLSSVERTIAYGGAEFLRFTGVQDLTLTLEASAKVAFHIILTHPGGLIEVLPLTTGENPLLGIFEQAVLVVVGVEPEGNELSPSAVPYTLSAEWTPSAYSVETLSYADPATANYTISLPYGTETAGAVRFTPPFSGTLESLELGLTRWLDGSPNPTGTGALRIGLYTSETAPGDPSALIPGDEIDHLDIPLDQLTSGNNPIDLSTEHWMVEAGVDFQIVLKVVDGSLDAAVSFDLDAGSTNTSDARYYPARTHRYFEDSSSWTSTWQDHGNLLIRASLSGTLEDAPAAPIPLSPVAGGSGYSVPLMAFWSDVTGASGYDVELDDNTDFSSPSFAPVGLLETWTELAGVDAGQTYYWRVRATNLVGASAWSEPIAFTTKAPAESSETLRYYALDALPWTVTLPYNDETAAGIRFTPSLVGWIDQVGIELSSALDGGSNPKGNGTLVLTLHEAERMTAYGPEALYQPGTQLGRLTFGLSSLKPGANTLRVADSAWKVTARDYLLVLSVEDSGSASAISFSLDNGSTEPWNQDYYPARTFRYFSSTESWDSLWLNHGNLAVSVGVSETEPEAPTPTATPEETPVSTPTAPPAETPTLAPEATPTPEGTTATPGAGSPEPTGGTPTETPGEDTSGGCACTQPGPSHGMPSQWGAVLCMGLLGMVLRRRGVKVRRSE